MPSIEQKYVVKPKSVYMYMYLVTLMRRFSSDYYYGGIITATKAHIKNNKQIDA